MLVKEIFREVGCKYNRESWEGGMLVIERVREEAY